MDGKDGENGLHGFQFRKPINRSKWETFQKAMYDSSTHRILGRTGKSWAQLLTFYALFYLVLAALFAICMQGLLATLDDKKPKWTLDKSLIGTNPGMGFRPIAERTEEGSLIWYNLQNDTSKQKWVHLLDKFLEVYNGEQRNLVSCDFDQPPVNKDKACKVDLKNDFGHCSPGNSYGYNSSSPCVFLKLNKIYGWVPEYITEPEEDMTPELKTKMRTIMGKSANNTQIWISCKGMSALDREHVSKFEYFPNQGFPSFYFPYTNQQDYLSPLIAVKVISPTPNIIVSIECRAWAKNINYRGGELQREGSVNFEILVDDPAIQPKSEKSEEAAT